MIMKKKGYKILTATFAMALVLASPMTVSTSYAFGFNKDAGYGAGGSDIDADAAWAAWEADNSSSSSSSESSSSGSESSYSEPSNSIAPSYSGEAVDSASSTDGYVSTGYVNNIASIAVKNPKDVVVNTTGGEKFRNVINKGHTSLQVYHCGLNKVTFEIKDADDNVVSFNDVKLEKGEDGLWYENITFPADVDTEDFTLTVTKGDATYLATNLGVDGIKINGTVVLTIKSAIKGY